MNGTESRAKLRERIERQNEEIEKLRRERDDLVGYLKGISRQTAEMVKAHTGTGS